VGMPHSQRFWRLARTRATTDPLAAWRAAKADAMNVEPGPQGGAAKFRTRTRFKRPRRHNGWISVGPELSQISADLMEAVGPALTKALDDELGPWARDVLLKWPRSSGLSAATVDLNYVVRGRGTFVATLAIRAPYANTIVGGHARKLVWSKVRTKTRAIAARAAADLAKV